ncbi:(2,3-dihydroxybenzoyl)adenylate synthase [Kocuria sp.]|uniref:(2,3-dihydroxybenzoyl)adenylate synthase n=1 Tax=Kocuria sp. TaxID=1871328 RepID=UPI0026E027AC|nr:AMP-binding protein [Kocuria sp.]MDO5618421.1 AMP-binding protein [Kocuria sp.]
MVKSVVDLAREDSTTLLATGVPADAAARYRALGLWVGQTHWDFLEEAILRHSQLPAATDRYRSLTYGQLGASISSARAALAAKGIAPGDKVVVQLPNSVAFVEAIAALFSLGAVPVFALPAHGALEIRHFCEISGAVAYLGSPPKPSEGESVVESLNTETPQVATIEIDESLPQPWVVDSSVKDVEPVQVEPSALAFLQLSGGTTAIPKLIPRTHDDYLYSVRRSVEICDLRRNDVMMVVLPCAHNFTMSSPGILGALYTGAHVVIAADPSPTTCMRTIARHAVTHVALVPPLLLSWLNSPTRGDHDLSSLRTLWVGGAKLSDTAARRVGPDLGCQLQQVFGMAEGLVNYTRLDDDLETVVQTQGKPMSEHDEVKVLDDDGHPVPQGEPGLLYTRGPYTIRRYYRAPEHNARSFTEDGFYRTGDIVRQRPSGHLVVVGRDKDQINRGGEKIAPEAVENELLAHESIHDVSVVGLPDEVLGERVCAYLIARPGADAAIPGPGELRRFLRHRGLASFAIPDDFRVVEKFPQTGVGKVSKKHQRQ